MLREKVVARLRRRDLRVPVTLTGPAGHVGTAMAVDISTGGMRLECAAALEPGIRYEASLSLNSSAVMRLSIEVLHRGEAEPTLHVYGVHFEQLSADDLASLFEFVSGLD